MQGLARGAPRVSRNPLDNEEIFSARTWIEHFVPKRQPGFNPLDNEEMFSTDEFNDDERATKNMFQSSW